MERFETGKQYLETLFQEAPPTPSELGQLALCALKTSGWQDAVSTFERYWQTGPDASKKTYAGEFSRFATKHKLTNKIDWTQNSPFNEATIDLVAIEILKQKDKATAIQQVTKLLPHLSPTPELDYFIGVAHRQLKHQAEAIEYFTKALESDQATTLWNATAALSDLQPEHEAVSTGLKKSLEKGRHLLTGNPHSLETFFKLADKTEIDSWLEKQASKLPYPAHRTYYRLLAANAQSNQETVDALLTELSEDPRLSAEQLLSVASLCQKSDRNEAAVRFLQRLTEGGYPTSTKWQALQKLAGLQIKANDFQEAITTVSDLYPVWRLNQGQSTMIQIYEAATEAALPDFEAGITALITQNPEHNRGAMLVGLYTEIAEKFDRATSNTQFPLPPELQQEATLLNDMIEQWEVAGPYDSVVDRQQPAAGMDLQHPAELRPSEVSWQSVGEKDGFGFVHLDSLFNLKKQAAHNKVAYARTIVTSPDDRTTTLALGSDDWAIVFLNGEEVHRYETPRSAFPDQDLVSLPLKAGENQLLLKVGNVADAWRFCARLSANDEGVAVGTRATEPK